MKKSKLFTIMLVMGLTAFTMTACNNESKDNKASETVTTASVNKDNNKKEEALTTDVNIKELAKQMAEKRTDVTFAEMTQGYIEGIMSFDLSKVSQYSVYVDASGTSIDEFGIFKANANSGDDVKKMLQSYLDMRLDTWMDEYMPEEKPKVEKAKIEKNGDYYMYAILGDSEKEEAFQTFNSAITQ